MFLTGVSDLSLAKFYGTYTTDNDKLNLGFNLPLANRYTNRLAWILNPTLEADVKKNFSKLYEDDKWRNNIRGGLKLTYLVPTGTLNFWGEDAIKESRKPDLKILRTKKFRELEKSNADAVKQLTEHVELLNGEKIAPTKAEELSDRKLRQKENALFEAVGIAEADYTEREKTYTWLRTLWVSAWGYIPLTTTEQYVSPDANQLFSKTNFKLWEINLQLNGLLDFAKKGTFYGSVWVKRFQNNSANAELLTVVDYGQYTQFPGSNPLNYALLETNKAFIGNYKEFMTNTLNLQLVYMVPWQTLLKPGLSVRYEKNFGDYSPANFQLGLPISIQGKDKPINIELQYRVSDLNNYSKKSDFETKKTLGFSFGLPFALLYK
jgi:hypothetical protein